MVTGTHIHGFESAALTLSPTVGGAPSPGGVIGWSVFSGLSSTAQSSSNMKKELKHTIFENVSTLRKLFVQLIEISERSNKKISEMEKLANHTMVEQGAANSRSTRAQGATSFTSRQELARIGDGQLAPTRMGRQNYTPMR